MTSVDSPSALDEIGRTAGSIWQLLHENGPMKMSDVVKKTQGSRDQVMQGIGWLAREQKISFELRGRSRFVGLN